MGLLLPGEISNVDSISETLMKGTLSESLGDLQYLEILDLWSLEEIITSESIPDSIGMLSNMSVLYLHINKLSGSIPASLGRIKSLGFLYLQGNELSGVLPSSLGDLVNLQRLSMANNMIGGPIPASWGKLSSLTELYLNDNRLSGSIPKSVGKLSKLLFLDLSHNNLSGSLPDELSDISDLQILDISFNNFKFVSVPMVISKLPGFQSRFSVSITSAKMVSKEYVEKMQRCQEYRNVWHTDLLSTITANMPYCYFSLFCGPCVSYLLRKRALYNDMSRYVCCAIYMPCSGSCGESQCPELCLCTEVFYCFGNSVASTCFLLQDEFTIQTTKCDNCIIAFMFILQQLACPGRALFLFLWFPFFPIFPSEEIDVMKVFKKVVASKSVGGLGMSAPLIVRFPDVLKHRLESLQSAFDSAMQMQLYGSFFQGIFMET